MSKLSKAAPRTRQRQSGVPGITRHCWAPTLAGPIRNACYRHAKTHRHATARSQRIDVSDGKPPRTTGLLGREPQGVFSYCCLTWRGTVVHNVRQTYTGILMATVTIRLDDDTREELEEIARTRAVNLSDLLRDQIDALLGRGVPIRGDVPHTLSFPQRQILAQQHEILALLHGNDEYESHHRTMGEVLREGYAGEYDSVFGAVQREMSRSECKLVWDVLDMFRMLGASIDRLPTDDRAALGDENEARLRFAGFDLNDSREGRLLGYVRYLVDTERWTEIKPRLAEIGDNGNSHSPYLATYERMLAVYMPIHEASARGKRGHSIDAWLLALDELKQVAEAWAWPDRG